MAAVDGQWDVTIKSPMGDQKAVLTVNSDGGSFSGSMSGGLGAMDIANGTVDDSNGRAHPPPTNSISAISSPARSGASADRNE